MTLVHVVEEFPADLPVDAVGFKPDEGPEMGDVTSQRASIKETVESETVRIKYGIKLAEPVETVQFDSLTIEDVETAEMTRSTATQTDGGERSSTSADSADESSSSFSSLLPSFGRGSAETERPGNRQSLDATPANATPEDPSTEPSETDGSSGDGVRHGAVESATERDVEPNDSEYETAGATGVPETAEETGTAERPDPTEAPEASEVPEAPGTTEATEPIKRPEPAGTTEATEAT